MGSIPFICHNHQRSRHFFSNSYQLDFERILNTDENFNKCMKINHLFFKLLENLLIYFTLNILILNRITRLKEGGFFEQWMTSEIRKAVKNTKIINRQKEFKNLNIDRIQSFFYLLIIGNILAFILLFLEIILFIHF